MLEVFEVFECENLNHLYDQKITHTQTHTRIRTNTNEYSNTNALEHRYKCKQTSRFGCDRQGSCICKKIKKSSFSCSSRPGASEMEQQIGRYGCEAVVRSVFDINDVITPTQKITPTPKITPTQVLGIRFHDSSTDCHG